MNRLKLKTDKIGILLLYLYVFFSYIAHDIVFPSILNTIFLYMFIIWGVYTILQTMRLRVSAYSKWYFAFLVYSMGIVLYSPKIEFLKNSQFYLMIVTLVLTYLIVTTIKTESDFKGIAWCYSISSFALVVLLFFTGNLVATQDNRLGGEIVGNANTFAGMIMVAVMFELWLLIYATVNKMFLKCLLVCMLALNMYAMFLSGGRKFIIVPIFYLYVLLIIKRDKKGRRKVFKYTCLILLIMVSLYFLMMKIPVFYDIVGYRMQFLINSMIGKGEIGTSASLRSIMKAAAIKKWLSSPVWGYGFDSFKYYNLSVTGFSMYSHCNYTELLYNGGVFYFIIYYGFYAWMLRKLWKLRKLMRTEYLAFAVSIVLSVALFDYGAVAYSVANIQILLCLSYKVLEFKSKKYVRECM